MEKVTLVLLPGLHGTSGLFEPLVRELTSDFEALAVEYPTQKTTEIEELVAIVMTKVANLTTRFVIIGESFSGPVSLKVASLRPKNLLGVFLVATFVSRPSIRILKYLPWNFGFHLVQSVYATRAAIAGSHKKQILMLMSRELAKVKPSVLAYRVKQAFDINAEQDLVECQYPLVYFRARCDIIVPKWCTKRLLSLRSIPSVTFETPHFLMQSSPKEAFIEIQRYTNKWLGIGT